MTETVCDLCKAIPWDLFRFELSQYKYELAPSFHDLEKGAQHGCASCKIFVRALQPFIVADTPIVLFSRSPRPPEEPGEVFVCFTPGLKSDSSTPWIFSGLKWVFHPGSPQEEMFGKVQYLPPGPVCDQNIELIKGLLENCLADHPSCRVTEQQPLPTRLLDLGEDPDVVVVRVVPGSRCSEHRGRYLTLSHCWGNAAINAPWKLTTNRTDEFASGVPFEILPKTFQETINLVKSIGERYLWVDSMCIIQDSKEDWEVEANRMADVYGGSLCTISTATDSTSGGCYLPRDVAALQPVEWKLSQTDFCDDQLDTTVMLFPYFESKPDPPVFRRAWCLQERELSHRLLQFRVDGWYWSCSMGRTSEGELYAENFDCHGRLRQSMAQKLTKDRFTLGDYQTGRTNVLPTFSHIAALKDRNKAYIYWRDIMRTFSRAKITFLSDRIPALYGLVARQKSFFPDNYAYGIWELDIIDGLGWSCSYTRYMDADVHTRIEPAIAPTWSFLSLQVHVVFYDWVGTIDVRIRMWFENMGEEIMSTSIRGCGYIFETNCSDDKHDSLYEYSKFNRRVPVLEGGVVYDTLRDKELVGSVHCLLLRMSGRFWIGLALARVPWAKDKIPTFRRVGFYEGLSPDYGKPVEFRII